MIDDDDNDEQETGESTYIKNKQEMKPTFVRSALISKSFDITVNGARSSVAVFVDTR